MFPPIQGSVGIGRQDGGLKNILESLDEEEEVKEVYSTSAELQSISSILQDAIHSIRSPLESAITTDTFLDVEGKDKERFEEQYTSFVAGVQRMESYICNYLKVCCRGAVDRWPRHCIVSSNRNLTLHHFSPHKCRASGQKLY